MSGGVSRDIVCRWVEALDAVDRSRLGDARRILWDLRDFSAKIWYNLAIVHLLEGDYKSADTMLQECLQRDGYLAVAQFQRGVIGCLQGRLQEAKELFRSAQKNVRTGDMIDYRQLGLALRLTLQQIEHNLKAVETSLTRYNRGTKMSMEDLQTLPPTMFRPAKGLVDNLEKQQFLKKAKVVSSVPHIDKQDIAALVRPQSSSAPNSPASHRKLVPAVNLYESHTPPPPSRPPPRLPPTSSSGHPPPTTASHPAPGHKDHHHHQNHGHHQQHHHPGQNNSSRHSQVTSSRVPVVALPHQKAAHAGGSSWKENSSGSGLPRWGSKTSQGKARGGSGQTLDSSTSADVCGAAGDKPMVKGGVAAMIRKMDNEQHLGARLQPDSQRSTCSSLAPSAEVSRWSPSPKPARPPPPQLS